MDRLLEKLWDYVAQDKTLTFQTRLFRLICLMSAMVCLLVVLPVNLFLPSIPILVNVTNILLGCFALFCYTESQRGRNRMGVFLAVLVGSLDPMWFLNGGMNGSITFYFFLALIISLVFWRGGVRWLVSGLILLNTCGLMVLAYLFPAWVIPFQTPLDQMLDLVTGIICSFVGFILVIWLIVTNYDWEQSQISRYARELAKSEENYRGVVENAMCLILRIDPAGKITFFNRFAEQLLGFKRAEIMGRPAVGSIVPEVSSKGENLAARIAELLRQPELHAANENECIARDGRRIWVNWTNQPIYDDAGRLQEILCVGVDFTERAALLEQLRLTQVTMDAAAEQILWTNEPGRIIYGNTAAVAALGYDQVELSRLTLPDLVTDWSAAAWAECWQQIKRERAATFALNQRAKDGTLRPVELSLTYIKVADKEYAAGFIRDLTERKLAEEKRRQHEAEMQHLQRLESLGVLAGGIAHDFNNLLTAILANVSLVKMDLAPTSEHFDLLAEAEKASGQARNLTAQLLTFAKGGKPMKRVTRLADIIRDSVVLALRGKAVKCEDHLASDLWPVEVDAGQLSQVFNNLFINACQAMENSGVITLRAQNHALLQPDDSNLPTGNYVRIQVQDQGKGIPPEHLGRIFDPYFTTKKSGSGLGLAVVHSIIKNHGGSVSVDSTPGIGTCFTLLFPAALGCENDTRFKRKDAAAGPRRILIMDDEEMVRKALSRMLNKAGYEVVVAADGAVALDLYQEALAQHHPIHLVIMDLTIPGGMGGQEAIGRLLELDPQAKAIVSSGYSDSPIMANPAAFGFQGLVAKPYTIEQIRTAVEKVLAD